MVLDRVLEFVVLALLRQRAHSMNLTDVRQPILEPILAHVRVLCLELRTGATPIISSHVS